MDIFQNFSGGITQKRSKSNIETGIDENLKRAFDEVANAPVPSRFTDLLDELKQRGQAVQAADSKMIEPREELVEHLGSMRAFAISLTRVSRITLGGFAAAGCVLACGLHRL